MKEPYEAALPGVFHGALYEKARLSSRCRALRFPAIKARHELNCELPEFCFS
jgi:hypothetical protein